MSYDEETAVRERLHRLLPMDLPAGVGRPSVGDAVRPGPRDEGTEAGSVRPGGAGPGPVRPGSADDPGAIGPPDDERPGVDRPRSHGTGPVAPWPPSGGAAPADPAEGGDEAAVEPVRSAAPPAAEVEFGADLAGRSAVGRVLPGPGAFDPGRQGVRALAVVAVLVVLAAAFWAWRSRPRVEPVAPMAEAATVTPSAPTEATATADGELVVAVAGKVRRPGLVRVPAGARVADAVQAAGGALPGVDVALLNPARRVADGELILVGVSAPPGVADGGAAPGGPVPGGGAPGAGGKVNLNTATLAQLDALPGVGPVLAQRILAHRDQHGGFRSVSDLRQVDGIGDARYEQLKDLVTV